MNWRQLIGASDMQVCGAMVTHTKSKSKIKIWDNAPDSKATNIFPTRRIFNPPAPHYSKIRTVWVETRCLWYLARSPLSLPSPALTLRIITTCCLCQDTVCYSFCGLCGATKYSKPRLNVLETVSGKKVHKCAILIPLRIVRWSILDCGHRAWSWIQNQTRCSSF
eukprot:IDg7154t1